MFELTRMLGQSVGKVILGLPDELITITRGSQFGSETIAYMAYPHRTGYSSAESDNAQ